MSQQGNGGLSPASVQSPVPAEQALHSGSAGFIIARSAQLKYEHAGEGRKLFGDVVTYMNQSDLNGASFFFYEELFGRQDRVHWLIHWKTPNDYAISLHMVDHDEKMIDLLESDRIVDDDAAGAWGRAVVEGSVQERIVVPQHGLVHEEGEHDSDVWVDPASLQTGQSPEAQLHSANALLTLHRVGQASHEFRKEARYYAFAWQNYVNDKLAGRVTSYLYEETFGVMDRLHGEPWAGVRYVAMSNSPQPTHAADVSDALDKAVASLEAHSSYLAAQQPPITDVRGPLTAMVQAVGQRFNGVPAIAFELVPR